MRVLLAPGNHDALLAGSIYSRTEWPANVHLFDATELAAAPARATASPSGGWPTSSPPGRATRWRAPAAGDDGGVHLALFHGAELGSRPDGKSIHGPFHAADIRERGFAAALCGHYHRRRVDAVAGAALPGEPRAAHLRRDRAARPGAGHGRRRRGGRLRAIDDNRWHARTATGRRLRRATASPTSSTPPAPPAASACAGLDRTGPCCASTSSGEIAQAVSTDTFTVETSVRDGCGVGGGARPRPHHPGARAAAASAATGPCGRPSRAPWPRRAAAADDERQRAVLDDALRYGLQALGGAEIGLR